MKKIILSLLAASLAVTAACSTKPDALPAGSDKFPTTSTTFAAGAVNTDATVKATTTTGTEAASAASACDVTREALLTGTQAEINASMKALMADKTADATAREYADYYLNRDKTDPSLQKMDISLIRMACS
jgi:hypothetical protein